MSLINVPMHGDYHAALGGSSLLERLMCVVRLHLMDIVPAEESSTSSSPGWKFWRRLSTRSRHDNKYLSSKERAELALIDRFDQSKTSDIPVAAALPSSGPLPDVVERAAVIPRFNGNSVPPPKPPRLFLIRTPSSVTRHSTDNNNETDPMYINSERVAELKAQRLDQCVDNCRRDSLPSYSDVISGLREVELGNSKLLLEQFSKPSIDLGDDSIIGAAGPPAVRFHQQSSSAGSSTLPLSSQVNSVARKSKIKTPELSRRWPGRSFRRSSDKGEISRQRHIMNSVSELLRQRLDPYPLLDQLKRSGVLNNVDVQSFLGHHDRKSVCEGLVGLVGEATTDVLNVFCEVLSSTGNCTEILEILEVIQEMDRILHDVACNTNSENNISNCEKNFSFEVGYLAPDYSLKPLVELERVRASSDKRLSKVSSRNSAHSLLEFGGSDSNRFCEPGIFPGLIMMSIFVTCHNLSGLRAQAVASIIRRHNCVSELHIGKTQLCGQDICVIVKALEDNRTVHHLDLRLNNLGHTGGLAVAELLQKTRSLHVLNLSSTSIDLNSLKSIAVAAASNRSLSELDLSFLDITDECCEYLRDMLKANSSLQKLRLRSNFITWSGCYVLAEGLVRNMSLSVLDLSRNSINDDGVQALAKFLPESCITDVCLENCGISAAGCAGLAELVTHCKKLKHLNISNNLLTDVGIFKLATALERTSSLENLGLNICGVTNTGFSKLLDVLEKNTSIVQLKLCYNQLGKEQSDLAEISDNLRYRLRIVTSSRPKLRILLWGNSFED
ncbi:hypothetical protein BsWGS_13792 [Bradybaena similaris]